MSEADGVLGEGRFLRLRTRGHWEYCERSVGSAVVVVVARTPEGEVLLVEQFRPALGAAVIEFPAGLVGDEADADEAKEAAAARELEEETGYRPGRVALLVEGPTSAGMTNEVVSFFHAHDLTRVGEGGGAGNERITVHRVPLTQVDAWLAARADAGVLVDPKVYAGLYFVGDAG